MQHPFAISFSGGGLSAVAYAGFIEVLKDHHIVPSRYAGLSGGALFAALLASGMSTSETLAFVDRLKTVKILNTHVLRLEIVDHNKFTDLLRDMLPYKTFESLPIPVMIFASDLTKKQPVVIQNGDLASAITASCSVFPFLQPVKRRGLLLGDGGFTVYYGAEYLHESGSKKIVGIDVTGLTEGTFRGFLSALFKQINTSVTSNARYELSEHPVDLDIKISFPSPTIFSFDRKASDIIELGRLAAQQNMHRIKKLVDA